MNRIETIASLTKGSNSLCDIGCDHGYSIIKAIKNYSVKKAIACDIASGPLNCCKENVKKNGLESQVSFVLSDGFTNVTDDFDTAIISGMGGILIRQILSNALTKIKNKKLVLEANSDTYLVREFLFTNGFKIIAEKALVDQEKYYEIIVAINGTCDYNELDIFYGPILRQEKPEVYLAKYTKDFSFISSLLPQITISSQKEEKLKEYRMLNSLLCKGFMEKKSILNTANYYCSYFLDELPRPTIVIAPGGAYKYTSVREATPVVKLFNEKGYHAVVVNYRETTEDKYPLPGIYLASVIKVLKVDKRVSKLIGLGFSAGGHNMLEVTIHNEEYQAPKVDLLMLAYPVVTADKRYWNEDSFSNLLKENICDKELLSHLSLEKEVKQEPDLFLWGTITDKSVDVMNSLLLIEAYHKLNLNIEYHLFPMGPHGLSVANKESAEGNSEKANPYIEKWVDFAINWLKNKLE